MLCETCQNITFRPVDDFGGPIRHHLNDVLARRREINESGPKRYAPRPVFYLHLPSLQDVEDSAKKGCHLCILMVHELNFVHPRVQERIRPENSLEEIDQVYLYSDVYSDTVSNRIRASSGTKSGRLWLEHLHGMSTFLLKNIDSHVPSNS